MAGHQVQVAYSSRSGSSSSSSSSSSGSSSTGSSGSFSQRGAREVDGVRQTGSWVTDGNMNTTFVPDSGTIHTSVRDGTGSDTSRTITTTTYGNGGYTQVEIYIPDRYNPDRNPVAMTITVDYGNDTRTVMKFDDIRGSTPKLEIPLGSGGGVQVEVAVKGWSAIGDFFESISDFFESISEFKKNAQIGFAYGVIVDYGIHDVNTALMNLLGLPGYEQSASFPRLVAEALRSLVTNEFGFYVGRATADVVVMLAGAAEMAVGAVGTLFGLFGQAVGGGVSATGVGALVGVPAALISAVIAAAGSLAVVQGQSILAFASDNFNDNFSKAVGNKSAGNASKLVNNAKMTTNEALDLAEDFLGKGNKDLGNGRFISADGTKQVRMGDSDILGQHGGGSHMNFETLAPNPNKPGKMEIIDNIHIYLTD